MMDMSTTNQTSMDIFREILDGGKPVTLYSANAKTRIPIGTIHRHFKQLEKTEKIRIYESVQTGRKKIKYGPTIYGMIHFYDVFIPLFGRSFGRACWSTTIASGEKNGTPVATTPRMGASGA